MKKIKIQNDIALAYIEGDMFKVKRLQWRLVRDEEFQMEAINAVTRSPGGNTPGIDGEIWETGKKREEALARLKICLKDYKAKPVKRVMIEKQGKLEKRPLGIPTLMDRTVQKLWSMALLPIAEHLADENSYGARPGKSTQDAVDKLKLILRRRPLWILEGDIKGFFDNISKQWLLNNIPMDKHILSEWLNMGFIYLDRWNETVSGVPQGGVISPMLANMVLDGLEGEIAKRFEGSYIVTIRYLDDFVITGASEKQLVWIREVVAKFLEVRGLTLHEGKTIITNSSDGIDFLGFNIKSEEGNIIKTRPTRKSMLNIVRKIRELDPNQTLTVLEYIKQYNSIIIGWTNYYKHCDEKWPEYRRLGGDLWKITHHWLTKRYPKASMKELWNKHYILSGPKGGTTMFAWTDSGEKIKMIPILKLWRTVLR